MIPLLSRLAVEYLPISLVHRIMRRQTENYFSFRKMFFSSSPELIASLQEKYLLYSFQLNSRRIPHYHKFLAEHKIDPKQILTKEDFLKKVPELNKKNYVYPAKDLAVMCIDGDYHNLNMIVKSSGHSGRQCYWAKSHQEDNFGKNAINVILDENFQVDRKRTLIINGFILGSWVTGINFTELASWHCPIINIGADKEEIIQTLKDIGGNYEQIIITGYPPFIKELVDYGCEQHFTWKNYQLHFIAGGEDFPESWRDYITNKIGGKSNLNRKDNQRKENQRKKISGKVRSGFGASDIGIICGMENDDTVFLRKYADKHPLFKKALFGEVDETPMLFQYPLNLYIYTNEKKELVFTTILPEALQPMIKYNLQDIGGVVAHQQMDALLTKFKINKKLKLPLPFFYVLGRESGPVKYNGFFIYPENVEECIYRNSLIAKTSTGNFKFRTVFDEIFNRKLWIEFQLKEGVKKTKELEKEYFTLVYKTLQEVNEGYRATCKKLGHLALPKILIYEFEKYPYTSKIKNNYSK